MDWIFTYQYELMYSFGALFALFSMMSYVAPAVQSALERGDNSMDSSENFFDGFDGLDLSSIISDERFEEKENDDVQAVPFGVVSNIADHQTVVDEVVVEEQVVEVFAVEEVVPDPVQEAAPVHEASVEEVSEVIQEEGVVSVDQEPEEKEEIVVASQPEEEKLEEEEEEEVIDYFSQSNLDVSGMSIEEGDDGDEEKYSAVTYDAIHSISEPVVDGFTKASVASPAFEPIKEESFVVNPVQKVKEEEVLKVAPQEMKEDLLVMRKREKLSGNKEEVLSLKKKKRNF
jgi:hypothetical protein